MSHRAYAVAALLLLVSASGCKSTGLGEPLFFGRAPVGSVHEVEIAPIKLADRPHSTNFRGRGTDAKRPAFVGDEVPDAWPIDNPHREIISPFGPRGRRMRLHAGVDIKGQRGEAVRATAGGLVVQSNSQGAYGKIVVIDHGNGYESVYAHLEKQSVEEGQIVKDGAQIGTLGSSGNATTTHVHYEVRKDGRPINPRPFIPGAGQ